MADFQLSWWEKLLLKQGLNYSEHRSPAVKKFIDEISSPALWATLAAAVPLIAQLFTATGNPHLAAAGGAIVAAYAIAVQLKTALLATPPPGVAPVASASPALAQVAASLASASAAHAAAASALPATVTAAKEAVTALAGVTDHVSELIAAAKAASASDAEKFSDLFKSLEGKKPSAPAAAPTHNPPEPDSHKAGV